MDKNTALQHAEIEKIEEVSFVLSKILESTVDEKVMQNYYNNAIKPIIDEMATRKKHIQ